MHLMISFSRITGYREVGGWLETPWQASAITPYAYSTKPRRPCTGATGSRKKASALSPSPTALVRLVFLHFLS
jgi:hypothetical protein